MYLALSFRFLVLEHVSGGELFDHLVKRGRLPLGEVTCLNYFCLSTSFNFYWKCNSAYFGLLYLSVSTCDMIGPFCRLYFIVWPTKCKSLFWLPKCVLKKNLEQTSGKLHKWGNTVKYCEKTKYKWRQFEGFCKQQVDGNVMDIPAALC